MIKDTGGTAFPSGPKRIGTHCDTRQGVYEAQEGMTLRDYFAASALKGILSGSSGDYDDETLRRENYSGFCDTAAESAYNMADAMLKAREV